MLYSACGLGSISVIQVVFNRIRISPKWHRRIMRQSIVALKSRAESHRLSMHNPTDGKILIQLIYAIYMRWLRSTTAQSPTTMGIYYRRFSSIRAGSYTTERSYVTCAMSVVATRWNILMAPRGTTLLDFQDIGAATLPIIRELMSSTLIYWF